MLQEIGSCTIISQSGSVKSPVFETKFKPFKVLCYLLLMLQVLVTCIITGTLIC